MKSFKTKVNMTPDAEAALERAGFSRRGFLKGAGMLLVGFTASGVLVPKKAGAQQAFPTINVTQVDSWLAIAQNEAITCYSGKCEFGQGFRTVQYQLISDELYVPFSQVNLIICDTAQTPDQGVTSGSQSHIAEFGPAGLRQALATARQAMLNLAATQFGMPASSLVVANGAISTADGTQSATYGQLIGGQMFNLTIDPKAPVKDPSTYTSLGTNVPRLDLPGRVTGEFQYIQTFRLPGMRYGKVVRPPAVGATVVSVDKSSVAGMPGNINVVVKNNFIGVVADTEYAAQQAVFNLAVNWSAGAGLPDQSNLYNWMRTQPTRDSLTVASSDVDAKFAAAAQTVSATYLHPYQMHGSLGSSCAVASVNQQTATIYCASQGVYPQRDSVAQVLGLPNTSVRVIFIDGSGCYGLNGADTVCYDAAVLSQADGNPVRVQFSRSDEMTAAEHFGPAYVVDLKAALDASNTITAWNYEAWTLSKGNRPAAGTPGNIVTGELLGFPVPPLVPGPATAPTSFANNSNAASSYGSGCVGATCGGTGKVTSERILTHTMASPFFTGPLRSPNRIQNTFANESFIDEVAAAAGADPVQYRIRHIADQRLIDVLNAAATAANWDTRPSPQPNRPTTGIVTGRGVACVLYEGNNGYAAGVVQVQVDLDAGVVTLLNAWLSQDSGPISNPNGLMNQMEGGFLQGCARAIREEVIFDNQSIQSQDWRSYPVYNWGDPIPTMVSVPINRTNVAQMGAGECTITLAPAAVANAIFDATGVRVRQVPFTPTNVLAALQGAQSAQKSSK